MAAGVRRKYEGMLRRALLLASQSRWLARNVPRYRFARAAARRFMPGEDLDAAVSAGGQLADAGIGAVLSRLGENVTSLETAAQVAAHYRMLVDRIAERGVPAHVSLKLTHLGLDLSRERAAENLQSIVSHAAPHGTPVWVDMEGSAYTDVTLDVFRQVRARHRNIGICLQAYLHRTESDLETLLFETRAIRLVKGAYREPAEIAHVKKGEIDDAFFRLALVLLRAEPPPVGGSGDAFPEPPPALGTHDVALVERVMAAAPEVPRRSWEVQMLYGIRSADQQRLAAEGHAVRVLISYGPEWFAWFVRRLAERPANLAFVAREFLRL